jgi:hypothetical protein
VAVNAEPGWTAVSGHTWCACSPPRWLGLMRVVVDRVSGGVADSLRYPGVGWVRSKTAEDRVLPGRRLAVFEAWLRLCGRNRWVV